MSSLRAGIAGIGFWANGLPGWNDAVAFARAGTLPENAPAKPSPQLLAPNERRRALSPTRFHNSVHNAAAGYWTIGNGCTAPTTAISAYDASFAQGLLEALSLLASGHEAVLLAAFDASATGPLATVSPSQGLLGAALVLVAEPPSAATRLRVTPVAASAPAAAGALGRRFSDNAMRPMLPLFDALATGGDAALLHAGPGRALRVECAHG